MLTAVASSTTADPTPGDLTATDTFLVRKGPSQGERYVRGVFPSIMGRPADNPAVTFWGAEFKTYANKFPNHTMLVPLGIIDSAEYRHQRIREAYQRILHRAASTADVTYWTGRLGVGGMSYQRFELNLLDSHEFLAPIAGGVCGAVYQAVLDRAPTTHECPPNPIAGAVYVAFVQVLQESNEAQERIIADRYQRSVGRAPSALDIYVWLIAFHQGMSPEALWANLLVSGEVLAKYPATQDDYGQPIGSVVPTSGTGFGYTP